MVVLLSLIRVLHICIRFIFRKAFQGNFTYLIILRKGPFRYNRTSLYYVTFRYGKKMAWKSDKSLSLNIVSPQTSSLQCLIRGRQASHPPVSGQLPEARVCSKPKCRQSQSNQGEASRETLIFKVHHCHHSYGFEAADSTYASRMPQEISLVGQSEVSGDLCYMSFPHRCGLGELSPIREESPSPVTRHSQSSTQ